MSCTLAKYNLNIIQGATFDLPIIYTDSTGSYINLNNFGAKMQIRDAVSSSSSIVYLTLSSSLNSDGTGLNLSGSSSTETGLVSPVSGNIGIYISAPTSSYLDFNEGWYDIFLYSGSYALLLLEGKVKINKRVTG